MLLVPKFARILRTRQRGYARVGVIRLTSRHKDHHLPFVTSYDEPFRIRYDLLDVETVAWRIGEDLFEFACRFAQNDLPLICADEDFALGQPAVGRVVLGQVIVFLLGNLAHLI